MKKIFFLLILLFVSSFTFSQTDNIPDRPSPQRLVNNLSKEFPQFLTASEQVQLERKLVEFDDSTSNQIAIVIVDDFAGLDENGFGTRLFNKWGIGHKKEDNGLLILVKPTGTASERKVYIVVGHGLESVVPDLTAKRIVENEIIPEFKNGRYYDGLNLGVDKLMGFAKGEFNSDEYVSGGSDWWREFKYAFIAMIAIIAITRLFRGGGGGMTMSRMGRTYWGGSFFSGGFGGGGGGGGFGGFGGGSSGGGGAGGSW